jgi:hypothetical protein
VYECVDMKQAFNGPCKLTVSTLIKWTHSKIVGTVVANPLQI